MKMGSCLQHEWDVSAWQATLESFYVHFKDKILAINQTKYAEVQPPKELTPEAVFMIIAITIVIILAVWGSFNTLCKEDRERTKPVNDKDWLSRSRTYLACFCLIKNGKKLLLTDREKIQFECFHGIKVISNFIIIANHTGMVYSFTLRNMDKVKPIANDLLSVLWSSLSFGVDAFFVLSGFLNAHSFSKKYAKNNGKIDWRIFYLKRFIRITPAYLFVFGFFTTLFNYIGSGPVWPEYVTNPVCKENWWWHLLYINNFKSIMNMCKPWCWHLAAEMQLYVISPIFLLSLLRRPRFGYSLASITIILASLSNFVLSKQYNLTEIFTKFHLYVDDMDTFMDKFYLYMDVLYTKPYTRITPYLIGVLFGYYFYDRNSKNARNCWISLCCGWITAGILLWISLFMLYKREESVMETALYYSVKHLFFSVGLSWIIFVCLTGQGGFINSFLSWKIFPPLAKLTYCAYLIHFIVILRDFQAAQDFKEFSPLLVIQYIILVCFWTFILSIPVSLLFEMPLNNLLTLYVEKREREEKKFH